MTKFYTFILFFCLFSANVFASENNKKLNKISTSKSSNKKVSVKLEGILLNQKIKRTVNVVT